MASDQVVRDCYRTWSVWSVRDGMLSVYEMVCCQCTRWYVVSVRDGMLSVYEMVCGQCTRWYVVSVRDGMLSVYEMVCCRYMRWYVVSVRDVYEKRYPHGHKTVHYKKARLELFAPYLQHDGLVTCITSFMDYETLDPGCVYEYYNHREDLLYFSLQNLKNESTVEEFLPGREDALKEHSYYLSQSHVEHERSMKFYHKARMDGLESIQMEPCHMTQHFKDRQDFLYHRHVTFAPRDKNIAEGPKRTVLSLSEKYHRDPTKPADQDVAERVFAVAENRMTLKFHYDTGNVSANILEFTKPPVSELGDRLTFNPAMVSIYQLANALVVLSPTAEDGEIEV
uniref:Dynein regulatory complex subunit 7 MORN domain-containing protein n=1 Tax=Timema shepardi TaxID=629360 RepID=A0A7R9B7N5_TIMSH|nr:unnamed protein product [Timema shepardi]